METKLSINNLIDSAPEKIQNIIYAPETAQTLLTIEKKYKIDNTGTGNEAIGKEVSFVLLGLTHPKDFVSNLIKKIPTDDETAKNIARDINREIFAGVKDLLMQIHGISNPKGATNTPSEPKIPVPNKLKDGSNVKKLVSPKPQIANPFAEKVAATTAPSKDIKKTIPPAPTPPDNYTNTEDNSEIPTPANVPTNPFEALLKKKMNPQASSVKLSTPTTEQPNAAIDNTNTKEVGSTLKTPPNSSVNSKQEHTDKITKSTPKLHTTIAQAVKNPDTKEETLNKKPAVDPYREALD